MNRQIQRVTVLVIVMFLMLSASLTSVQGLARPALWEASSPLGTLTTDTRNLRTTYAEYGTHRGQIMVGDTTIAESQPSNDNYAFQRVYPNGPLYAPITGYFSTAFSSRTGMELAGNSVLNGQDPSLFSSRIQALFTGETPQGGSLELTINPTIQQAAWNALDGRAGSVVVLNPSTGAILAMVSSPSYDPNQLATHDAAMAQQAASALENDPNKPLSNRAIAGDLYPPGSTFKILTLAAALRQGKINTSTEVAAPDTLTLPGTNHALTNYDGEKCGNGTVTVAFAFAESCNTPFAQMGMDVGDKDLAQEAKTWGFETTMSVPMRVTPSVFPANDSQAQTAMAAIGQASVRTTPLMMAMVAATIANDGEQMTPYLVNQTLDPDLNVVSTTTPTVARTPIDEDTAQQLTEVMTGVVSQGTGKTAQVAGVSVAGKTGTAETGSKDGGPTTWFVGFAGVDIENPSVALAVVVDGGSQTTTGGTGGSVAGPIAAQVIDAAVDQ